MHALLASRHYYTTTSLVDGVAELLRETHFACRPLALTQVVHSCLLDVKTYCCSIHTLNTGELFYGAHRDDLADLLVSFRAQMKNASFWNLTLSKYELIALHCPKLDCWVRCELESSAVDAMMGLGDRLVRLSLEGNNPLDDTAFQSCAPMCNRLAHVQWKSDYRLEFTMGQWETLSAVLHQIEHSQRSFDFEDSYLRINSSALREVFV